MTQQTRALVDTRGRPKGMAQVNGGFRSDIQGLRAIAVGSVVLYHASLPFIPGGYVGVDVFFVISGFLITSHLLRNLAASGRISFSDFYAKRARRILPASFVVLFLSLIAALIWYPPLLMPGVWAGAVATALYVPNYLFAVQGTNYLAESAPSLFQHYWSLGIEEQFYLVWPVLLSLGFLLVKSRRWLFVIVSAIVVVSFAACVVLTYRNQPWAFFSLPTRAWELGAGGLAAFLLAHRPNVITGKPAAVLGWLGVGGIVGSALLFTEQTPFPSYWAVIPVVATALVIVAGATSPRLGPSRVLSVRGMIFVGTISYSLYLVHWPMQLVPQAAAGFGEPLPTWAKVLIALASVPVAWLIYRYVEEPTRNAHFLTNARPRRSLLAACVASVLLVTVATGALLSSNNRPLHTNDVVAPTVITDPPRATNVVPSNLQPTLSEVADDQPILYDEGCHRDFASTDSDGCVFGPRDAPRIAIFGDSHAAQWFPALMGYADANGYAVETFTKSSCPSIDAAVKRNGVPYSECMIWRAGVIDKLNARPPVMVVIANYGVAALVDDENGYASSWEAALKRTLEEIHAPKAVIVDTPNVRATPSTCLSAHLADAIRCGASTAVALDSPTRAAEVAATSALNVALLDMTPFICSPDWCPPIVGDTLVYRDAHHITATFSKLLAKEIGAKLAPILQQ